jgi:uncharacterized membrane protein YqjE
VAAVLLLLILGLIIGLWRMVATRRATRPPRVQLIAPDDDPDFLRELDRRTRRRQDDEPA